MSFNTINYLLFEKKKRELDKEMLDEFSPFITTKFASFYENGKYVDIINDTLNRYSQVFKTKEEQFKFFDNIIIKDRKRKINYIKKPKKDKSEVLPIPEFYSKREIDMMEELDKYNHDTTSIN